MADTKISGLAELTSPAAADLLTAVDVSDTSMAATGTNKRITASLLGDLIGVATNAKLFGAVGDGVTDDAAAIQAGIDTLAAAGGVLYFPAGTYYVPAVTLNVPSNVSVVGQGSQISKFLVEAGRTVSVFSCDAVSFCRFADFSIEKSAGAAVVNSHGIIVRGNASDIVIERVQVSEFTQGFRIAGIDGAVAGTCQRITLRNCIGAYATSYGIRLSEVDGVTVDNCWFHHNAQDGAKLQALTKNVTFNDGYYEDNGTVGAGDGLDAFAGGDSFQINGGVYRRNSNNGITIKTDTLTRDSPLVYGYVRRVQVQGTRCVDNGAFGLTFYTSWPAGDTTIPLAAHATLTGNLCGGNTLAGIYINGRNVTASNNICRRNGTQGIHVTTISFDVSLIGNQVIANSQTTAGASDGILIEGKRISVSGGNIVGVDADTVKVEGDYAALTKYHRAGIYIAVTAREITVSDVNPSYSASGAGFLSVQTGVTDGCVVRLQGTIPPNTGAGVYGGVGSQYIRISSLGTTALWRKVTGAPNASTTGWQREYATVLANQTIGVTQTAVAHGLGYTPTEITIVPRADARVWRSAAADATNVYFAASASVACDITVR